MDQVDRLDPVLEQTIDTFGRNGCIGLEQYFAVLVQHVARRVAPQQFLHGRGNLLQPRRLDAAQGRLRNLAVRVDQHFLGLGIDDVPFGALVQRHFGIDQLEKDPFFRILADRLGKIDGFRLVEPLQYLLLGIAQRSEEYRREKLALPVDTDVQMFFCVEFEIDP